MGEQAKLSISKYKIGTYITIEGNEGKGAFFIIKQGQVQVHRSIERMMHNPPELLKVGDFFGVIAAMSGHPSTETVIAMSDVEVIAVRSEQFGYLIKQNTPIAMKIIKYFSHKLRFFDSLLTRLTSKKAEESSDVSFIYEIAEYYFKNGAMPLALYAYHRYMELVHGGPHVADCQEKMERYARFKQEAFNPPANISGFNRKYRKNTFIFAEHEPGDDLFIIQQGKVKITKLLAGKEVLLAVLKAGDIFGEMALLENKPRSASAIAFDEDVTMLAVNRQNFSGMVVEQPQLATRLITILSERIWSIYRQINNLLLGDIPARTYDTMLTLVMKEKVPIKRNEKYLFEFGANELMNMMGLTSKDKESIMEALSDRLFRVETNRIVCNDLEELDKRVKAHLKKLEILRKTKRA